MHIDQQHKIQLSDLLLKQIIDGIHSDNANYLPFMKIAKEQELFFPEMNWSLFAMGLAKSFSWNEDLVAKNYGLFRVNAIQAGRLYHDTVEAQVTNFLFAKTNGNYNLMHNKNKIGEMLKPKFKKIIEYGLVLPEEFFASETIAKYLDNEVLQELRQFNLHNHLDSSIPNKPGNTSKVKL